MAESNNTNLNDVNGPALPGTFYGEVNINSVPDVKELAQALIEEYGPRHASIAVSLSTSARLVELENMLTKRFDREDIERHQRQEETDMYRVTNERRLERIESAVGRSIWTSMAALAAAFGSWVRR